MYPRGVTQGVVTVTHAVKTIHGDLRLRRRLRWGQNRVGHVCGEDKTDEIESGDGPFAEVGERDTVVLGQGSRWW